MPVFFVFSDESGKYKKERTEKFIAKNPFYCRSAVFIEAQDWLRLRDKFLALKKEWLGLEPWQSVKWSYIWSLFKHRQKGETVPSQKPYYSLRKHSLDYLIAFVRQALQLLFESESSRILLTMTFNEREKTKPVEKNQLIQMHLEQALKMAEKEMRKRKESICVFFFNPEEPPVERDLKESFHEILNQASLVKFGHIKDSLAFEALPQSFGGQVADYCAGIFYGCLRFYPQSIDLFRHQVWPKIIKEKDNPLGWGITEIPKNQKNRAYLEGTIKKIFATQAKNYQVSLEERLKK
jgi:hypothetical protein